MKLSTKPFTLLFLLCFCAAGLRAQGYQWAETSGGLSLDEGLDVTTDASGNIYTCGYYDSDTAFFGSSTTVINTVQLGFGNPYEEIFLAKYNANGDIQWAVTGGSEHNDRASAVAVDGSGNVYIAGIFSDTATLGGQTLITRANTQSAFLAKFDPNGSMQWVRTGGGNGGNGQTFAYTLDVDDAGNCYMGGYFVTQAIFNGTTYNPPSGYTQTGYVVKYNTSGDFQWFERISGVRIDRGKEDYGVNDLVLHPNGNGFAVTGTYQQAVNFESDLTETASPGNRENIYLAWYGTDGVPAWARSVEDAPVLISTPPDVNELAVHSDGSIYMAGNVKYSLDFGGGTVIAIDTSNWNSDPDIFLAKFDNTGSTQWVVQEGLDEKDECRAVALDDAGNVYITGTYQEQMTIGSTTLEYGNSSVFIAKYNAQGSPQWAHGESQSLAELHSLTVPATDQVLILGFQYLYAEFGSLIPEVRGSADALLLKYSQSGAGIWEDQELEGVQVWPNPMVIGSGSGELNFKVSDGAFRGVSVRLLDLTGRELVATEMLGVEGSISLGGLENGIYLLELAQGEIRTTRKVMVKH